MFKQLEKLIRKALAGMYNIIRLLNSSRHGFFVLVVSFIGNTLYGAESPVQFTLNTQRERPVSRFCWTRPSPRFVCLFVCFFIVFKLYQSHCLVDVHGLPNFEDDPFIIWWFRWGTARATQRNNTFNTGYALC